MTHIIYQPVTGNCVILTNLINLLELILSIQPQATGASLEITRQLTYEQPNIIARLTL